MADRRVRLSPLAWGAACLVGLGAAGLVTAAAIAAAQGEVAGGLAYGGLALALGGFALAVVRSNARVVRTESRVDAVLREVTLSRMALKSVGSDVGSSNRLLKRMSAELERRNRLEIIRGDGSGGLPAGVEPGLLSGILGIAPQRVVLCGPPAAVAPYVAVLGELSPVTSVLILPAPEHRGAFFQRLAAEGRTRKAPVPVLVAIGEATLREVIWGDTAVLALERLRVDELLVLSSTESRAALREAPEQPAVRATPVGAIGIIVATGDGGRV
jgi:hypothetical protein